MFMTMLDVVLVDPLNPHPLSEQYPEMLSTVHTVEPVAQVLSVPGVINAIL